MNKLELVFEMIKKLKTIVPLKYKRKILVLFSSMFVASFMEMLGVAMIIPFMDALTNYEQMLEKPVIKWLVTFLNIKSYYSFVVVIGLLLIAVYLVKNIILLAVRNYQNKIQNGVVCDMSIGMLSHITHLPYSYFLNVNSSELLTQVFEDSNNIFSLIGAFLNILGECLTILAIGIFIFVTDPLMSLGAIIVALFCALFIVGIFKNIAVKSGRRHRDAYSKMYKDAIQTLGGIKEIKIKKCSQHFLQLFKTDRSKYKKESIINNFMNLCPERITETVFICGIILVLLYRIRLGMDVKSSIGALSAFAVAGYRLMPSINKIASNINTLVYFEPSLNASYSSIIEAQKLHKSDNEVNENNEFNFTDAIKLKNIIFKYNDEDKEIISNLSLTIKKGLCIGIIGESGSGKTTLMDIILGLLSPDVGNLTVDGVDIKSIPNSWSRMLGYVSQTVYLLDASIRENIAFGIDENMIDDKKVWLALDNAKLKDFVLSLPQKENTVVGEQGVRLSGGQRQRIAIARALYNDPDVLVLDEATSALDNDTESSVMEAIEMLHGKKTLIIVAHRLSTISGCDEIYEIKNGQAIKRNKTEVLNNAK